MKTTFEMDGLFTQEDIDNRFYVMSQCKKCKSWTQYDTRTEKRWICECGDEKYDHSDARSIRTWLATKNLRVVKARNKKASA